MSATVRRPGKAENVLMKPYFWHRPTQLLRRMRLVFSTPIGLSVIRLPWGLSIECDPQEMIGSSITRTGVFEIATTEALVRLADPGEVAIDVGANIGYMTSVLAARLGVTGRVIAFEPNPSLYPLLVSNVERWRADPVARIETSAQAVSEQVGTAELAVPAIDDRNQSTATLSTVHKSHSASDTISVETTTLDRRISMEHIGVLKLDVEGHEAAVLRGARHLITERRVRDVVFEDHHAYPSAASRLLEQYGYAVFALAQRPFGVRLLPPASATVQASWDAPMRLATRDPTRACARLRRRGWLCLRPHRAGRRLSGTLA